MRSQARGIFSLAILCLSGALTVASQQLSLEPKPSPTTESLNATAKKQAEDQKRLNDAYQQARSTFDANKKVLADDLTNSSKALEVKLQADKHYKVELAHIDQVKKQLNDLGAKANQDFTRVITPIQQRLTEEDAQSKILIPIVRQENGWGPTATYNLSTQKWSDIKPASAVTKEKK